MGARIGACERAVREEDLSGKADPDQQQGKRVLLAHEPLHLLHDLALDRIATDYQSRYSNDEQRRSMRKIV